VATETDAARDRVLAARAVLAEELEVLEASARAAVDVPAKIRRNPVRTAAVVGGLGFVALGGPRRLFRRGKRAVFGAPAPMPKRMLPEEIEKTLRKLGDDGDKVRGALERDFSAYAREASNRRQQLTSLLVVSVARPLLTRGTKALAGWLFRTDDEGFQARLAQIRERAARTHDDGTDDGGAPEAPKAGATARAEAKLDAKSAEAAERQAAAEAEAGSAGA
jgi:hypothetical protein